MGPPYPLQATGRDANYGAQKLLLSVLRPTWGPPPTLPQAPTLLQSVLPQLGDDLQRNSLALEGLRLYSHGAAPPPLPFTNQRPFREGGGALRPLGSSLPGVNFTFTSQPRLPQVRASPKLHQLQEG